MALSRQKKEENITEVQNLLAKSKMTVFARYSGTPVKSMEQLRSIARENGTSVKVIKNRLFKKALESGDQFAGLSLDDLRGQLLYAFNADDEAAPAQGLAAFARSNPQIEFVGAISSDGQLLSAEDVKTLAALPGKEQLRAQLAATVGSPVSGLVNVIAANVRGLLNVLNSRAESLTS